MQLLDARSAGRFSGTEPEPRPGLRSGHIPGSLNLPFANLLSGQSWKTPNALKEEFAKAGIDLDLVYVATRNRVVFGAADIDGLKAALGVL